jgi:hypothetical protein
LLYLKRCEGLARDGKPIRPVAVTSRTHELTRLPAYEDRGFIRTDYHDIEDSGWMHVIFADGTFGDVVTGEVTLGGIYDYVEVFANNHRARCRLSPTNLLDMYNPKNEQFHGIYLMEKLSSTEGWNPAAPDENLTMGRKGIKPIPETIVKKFPDKENRVTEEMEVSQGKLNIGFRTNTRFTEEE